MIIQYRVDEKLPFPARTALNVVQTALKVNRSSAANLIHEGAVMCGGRPITQTHTRLEVGDQLEIDYLPQPAKPAKRNSKPSKGRFEVIFDDPHLLVVNKPADLLTIPSKHHEKNTLKSQIDKWLTQHGSSGGSICVHRLDRGVSGLLVFAKDLETAELLREQFAQRKPRRKYAAVVQGHFAQSEGSFRSYLATDEKTLQRFSTQDPEQGQLAITHYRVIEQWGDVSLLEVKLETGRRNQIRVHLAEAGHPILGDPRYRSDEAQHPWWPYRRLALHAETLGLIHPHIGEPIQFSAPWPQEFRDLRRKLRRPK